MTRADALRDLLAKVEAGGAVVEPRAAFPRNEDWSSAERASRGSLDAAKALHEAVLPGWGWARSVSGAMVTFPATDDFWEAARNQHAHNGDNPARAWFIAILKALIATEDN